MKASLLPVLSLFLVLLCLFARYLADIVVSPDISHITILLNILVHVIILSFIAVALRTIIHGEVLSRIFNGKEGFVVFASKKTTYKYFVLFFSMFFYVVTILGIGDFLFAPLLILPTLLTFNDERVFYLNNAFWYANDFNVSFEKIVSIKKVNNKYILLLFEKDGQKLICLNKKTISMEQLTEIFTSCGLMFIESENAQ